MLDKFKPQPKGSVQIYSIKGLDRELIYEDHNAILPNAVNVMAAMLAVQPLAKLDTIEIRYLGSVICSRPIIATSLIASDTVQYQAQFEMTSFFGPYDKVKMLSSTFGDFSNFSVSLTKATSEQIAIVWNIQIT